MTLQTFSQLVLLFGLLLSALGGFGSYFFGKIEEADSKQISDKAQAELKAKIEELQANATKTLKNTELIFQALNVKPETWTEVKMNNVPPGVTAYLLLLFSSDKGRISGKVRIKGSEHAASFSTTANNRIPVALRNLWLPKEGLYKIPTVMEFTVTEQTAPNSSLSIYTAGWIHTRGEEPH